MEFQSGEGPHLAEFLNPVAQPVDQREGLERLMFVTLESNGGSTARMSLAAFTGIVGVDAPFSQRVNHGSNAGFEIVSIEGG